MPNSILNITVLYAHKLLIYCIVNSSSYSKVKDEKRPWVLRAREASVQIGSKATLEDPQSLPKTLIYISCGWESFKEVHLQVEGL